MKFYKSRNAEAWYAIDYDHCDMTCLSRITNEGGYSIIEIATGAPAEADINSLEEISRNSFINELVKVIGTIDELYTRVRAGFTPAPIPATPAPSPATEKEIDKLFGLADKQESTADDEHHEKINGHNHNL